jgi:DNA-binding transcriptional ArsR family regulator
MAWAAERRQGDELWAAFWRAFGNPVRLRILDELRDGEPLNVGELVNRLQIGQGHLSNHLKCLRDCGLVQTEGKGRYVYYRMADPRIAQLLDVGERVFTEHLSGVAACRVVRARPSEREEGDE